MKTIIYRRHFQQKKIVSIFLYEIYFLFIELKALKPTVQKKVKLAHCTIFFAIFISQWNELFPKRIFFLEEKKN